MTIVKYKNRKLYWVEESKYITLTHLLDSHKLGYDIMVTEHESGNDITEETLFKAMCARVVSEGRLSTAIKVLKEVA